MGNGKEEPASCSWVALDELTERGAFLVQSLQYIALYFIVSNSQKELFQQASHFMQKR